MKSTSSTSPVLWIGLVLFAVFLFMALSNTIIAPTTGTLPSHAAPVTRRLTLVRIGQLDPTQYTSQADFTTWAYSACSTAAMTEVMNAYGRHYRIADVLQVEAHIGAITPQLGLLEGPGIGATVAHFGFKTTYMHDETLNDVINVANTGTPVIVGFPPAKYPGGHLLVVTGGDARYVYLVDSSLYNRHALTHAQFLYWWGGFAVIVRPEA